MMNLKHQPTLLSLDDDVEIGRIIATVADQAGFKATVTQEADAFHQALSTREPDVIVLDLQIPGTDGVQMLRRLADVGVTSGIVLVTGMDGRTIAATEQYALKRGLQLLSTVRKPFLPEDLLRTFLSVKALTQPLDADDVERAIDNGQLIVHYQPVVRHVDNQWEVDSVEALLRWEHPERGTLKPDAFLKLGEDHGLARGMTDFVIRRGLEQIKGWSVTGLALGLRINLSAALITDIEFPDRLEASLSEFDLPAGALTLELSETAMFAEHPATFDILTRLRLKDFALAIDDFGIGYSSLTQLFRMPFSEMKIDRALIAQIPVSRESQVSVEALVGLAHKLGLQVCGEGVEDEQSLNFLAVADCESAQGYLVSPPVSGKDIPEVVRAWNDRRETRDEHERHAERPATRA